MKNHRNHRNHRGRRNKFRSNDRIFRRKPESISSNNINYISNGIQRQSFGKNNHNAPKLLEKYNNLAREALSSGDKILSENYLQHADHFSRILSLQEFNKSQILNNNVIEKDFKKDTEEIKTEVEKNDNPIV